MNWFSAKIFKWKHCKDTDTGRKIIRLLKSYHFSNRRKDFIFETLLRMDFTNEELTQLSNELGQLAHFRERYSTVGSHSSTRQSI